MRARVSLALLSLRENGGLLVVYSSRRPKELLPASVWFPVAAQANNGGQEYWDFPSNNSKAGDLPQTMLNIILRKMG